MTPELSIIRLVLSHIEWQEAVNSGLSIEDFPKELQTLFSVINTFHSSSENSLSVADLANLVFANISKDHPYYQGVLEQLEKLDVSQESTKVLVNKILLNKRLKDLSLSAYEVTEGRLSYDKFCEKLSVFEYNRQDDQLSTFEWVSDDLTELANSALKTKGLRWRLKTLNQMLGSLRKGDFGFVFARPETGKTTFLASEVTYMCEQLSEEDGPILWINNEEQSDKVKIRCYQASLGLDLSTLLSNLPKHTEQFLEKTKGKLKINKDAATIHKREVERLCKELKPSLIIFDQIDKIVGFENDREDLKLGAIYQWARELAKLYAPVIAVCQADGSGEGVKWLTMSNVANAKCLSPETAVLMYDGSWKAVADVKVGEQVMGPDSSPRNVLSVSSGTEEMYRVTHKIGGDWYEVNKSHILSLITQYGEYVNKNVLDYKKGDFGYRVGHELDEQVHSIEPYYLGLWLGDGKASAPEITTMDREIKEYVSWYAKCWGCSYVEWQNGKNNPELVQAKIKYKQGVKHPVMEALRQLNLVDNKHIPDSYFKGSIQQRLELIAGLLDTDGSLSTRKHQYYVFSNKNYQIAYGLKLLALSCGLMATFKQRGKYYYVSISGNDLSVIPCRIAHKKSIQKAYKNVLKSRLDIQPLGVGSYAGFTLDGDHQFIIEGNIVTHNTAKQAEADWILGIGKVNDAGYDSLRFLHTSKNKLIGDEDSIPDLRHGRMEVLIEPTVARYKDLR